MSRGGKRAGAGRPAGSGRFGEKTVPVRVPESLLPTVLDLIANHASASDQTASPSASPTAPFTWPAGRDTLILPPRTAESCLQQLHYVGVCATTTILDPWYSPSPNRRDLRSHRELVELIARAGAISEHVFIWGWPVDIAPLVERIPPTLVFRQWLTWHYRNVPSKANGWRPSQQACLHLSRAGAALCPGNFNANNDGSLFKFSADSVITAGALAGYAGRSQRTGHPAQKPLDVIKPLILMTSQPGDIIIDPMGGSGTTADAARQLGRRCLTSDLSDKYTRMMEARLGVERRDWLIGNMGSRIRTASGERLA